MRIKEITNEEATLPATSPLSNMWNQYKAVGGLAKLAVDKATPWIGAVNAVDDALNRYNNGDTGGAVISILAGAGYLIPRKTIHGFLIGASIDFIVRYAYEHPEQFVRPEGRLTGKQATQNMRQAQTGMDTPANPNPRLHPELYPR